MENLKLFENTLRVLEAALSDNENIDCSVDISMWPEISRELDDQAVLPLVSDYMARLDIGKDEKLELIISSATNAKIYHGLMAAQNSLLKLFSDNDIPVAVMKGAAAAQYYPKPSQRCFGDIDVLVLPEDYRRTFDLLLSSGYKNIQEYDAIYDRHIGFITPEGYEVELHRYFSSSSNREQNALFDGWLFDKLKATEEADIDGYKFPSFPRLENGLILLGHVNQHLSSGLGFRQIIDWMMYVRQELDDAFWNAEFKDRAEAIGMACLAKTVTRMCQMYLGLSSDITWCADADDDLAEELMLYIFVKGNFGTKQGRYRRDTLTVVHYFTNPKTAIQYLVKGGMIHMKAAGLRPIKLIAPIYQIGHLIRMTLKRDDDGKLTEEIKVGTREADLMRRLKVTRM